MAGDDRFAELGWPKRIWAIAAIHGEINRLMQIHDALLERIMPGDRILYLGNYGGAVGATADVIDELLAFRRYLLARPGYVAEDLVYLRGTQEEIWQKLLQIQFAPNPRDVYDWMLRHGIAGTLASYGSTADEGRTATRDGAPTMTRWTNRLRTNIRQRPGHEKFMTVLRRAAFSQSGDAHGTLFVHSGLDPARPIGAQKDSFWWNHAGFNQLDDVYEGFARVVRGSDPARGGLHTGKVAVTLDRSHANGGSLVMGCFAPGGTILELLEV